ncbi:non-ribosomal peptide synthase protein (TIGR01720 family)/amino acid adenylation domain-containing protein, partial [Kordia periserrulae]
MQIKKANVQHISELNELQKGILFDSLKHEDFSLYNTQIVLEIHGELHTDVLQNALYETQKHNDVLRSVFDWEKTSKPLQIILKELAMDYKVVSISENTEAQIDNFLNQERKLGFNLNEGCPVRVRLLKKTTAQYLLVITHHTILYDGWSNAIFLKDIFSTYHKLQKGEGNYKNVSKVQYKAYLNQLQNQPVKNSAEFWKTYLEEYTPGILSKVTAENDTNGTAREKQILPIEQLTDFCKKESITKASLIYVAYGLLLQKYADSDDVMYGTPVSTRNPLLQGADEIMGNFVNTLPLRFRSTADERLIDIIKRTDKELLTRNEHNNSSLNQVKTFVQSSKENELFNTILAIENYPVDNNAININKEFTLQLYATYESVEAPLLVQVFFNTSLEITVQYATNYFSKKYIQRLLNHFKNCIHQLLSNPSLKKKNLHILDTDEREELLLNSNGPKIDYSGKTILDKFDEIVKQHGSRKAVSFEGIELSYQELDEKSTQLAKKIRLENAFSEDKLIPICLQRSEKMILAILSVLKAGCAYVPMDPTYPVERKKYILQDTDAKIVITTSEYEREFADYGYNSIVLDAENDESLPNTTAYNLPKVTGNDTIYVIYTSGTTGKPKGVINTHQGLNNKMMWMLDYLAVNAQDVVLQKTTYCFDVSFWEFFLPLLAGGTLVLAKPEGEKDSEYLANIINEKEITITHFVPSMLNAFLLSDAIGNIQKLRAVVCSGEALKLATVQHFKKILPKVELHNLYGPTEAGIEVTTQNLTNYNSNIVPIGKPVANTQMYIVDREQKLQPIGSTGDLLIGGIQVAEGYRNLAQLTQEKFQKDPFKKENRIYKTGDKARWLPDGTIEFLGRADSQIKLRGYRIEIGEIESILEKIPELYQSAVQLQDIYGNQHLVCYYVLQKDVTIEEESIQEKLRAYLPAYMIPRFYKQLEEFPVTSNGKLDRKKLPQITIETVDSIVLPETAEEEKMLAIWTSLLGVASISVTESFFVLGGDSIKAIQLMSRCKNAGLHFKIKDIFNYPSIRSLCKNLLTETTTVSESGKLQGTIELLSIQQEFLNSNPHTPEHYNQSAFVSLSKKFTSDQLKNAVQQLMEHHDMLRALFVKNDDEYTAYYGPLKHNFFYTEHKGRSSLESICMKFEASLKLEESLCKFVHILDEEAEENKLFIVAHHLVIDGISWRILLEDLENILLHETQGESFTLPQKQTSFRQWASKLKQHSEKILHSSEQSYWLKLHEQFQLENTDKETIPTVKFGELQEYRLQLNATETSALLQNIHTTFGTNINDVLLSALVVAMNAGFNLAHFYIALEGHGREDVFSDVDISRTIGWFTSIYPVRLQHHADVKELLIETKDTLRDIPNKGIGYGLLSTLCEDAQIREKLASIKPTILFNYLGSFDEIVKKESLFGYEMDTRQLDVSPNNKVAHNLAINSMVVNNMLDISITYNPACYTSAEIQRFANTYHQAITQITTLCNAPETSVESSRSDYGLPATVKNKELNAFKNKRQAQYGKIETIYPLSALQEGILFHSLFDESTTAYVSEFSFDITDGFDKTIFEKSWNHLAKQHEILRAGIYANDLAVPVQCIYERVVLNLIELDCRELSESEVSSKLSQIGQEGIQLETPPLFKITLVRISDTIMRVVVHYHHILWDGWSLSILMNQFLKVYNNLYTTHTLPVIKGSRYRSHVEQIKKYQKYNTSKYWKEYLKNSTEETYIPFIKKPLKRNKIVANTTRKFSLGEEITKLILKYSKENEVTVNTIIQGCWGYMLHKYTGQEYATFGAITSGRNTSINNMESAVGLYINTLPVVVDCTGELSISDWLSKLQQEHAFTREEYGYDSLVRINEYLNKSESLFDSLLVFENYPVDTSVLNDSNLKIQNLQSNEYTNYALTLEVIIQENDIAFNLNYHDELLDHHTVSMIEKHILQVLNSLHDKKTTTISDVELLAYEEKQEILKYSTGATVDYGDATLLDMFREMVAKKGTSTALHYEGETMSYKELDSLSDDLAGYLIEKGILGEDKLVPISLDRGFTMVVGILGILKSGGAYVPIDPLYPASRKRYILEDINAKTILTSSDYQQEYHDLGYDAFPVDRQENYQTNDKIALPKVTLEDTIYVLYTSGSTGVPKGVINTHEGLYNRLLWMRDYLSLDENDVVLQKTTFCFDVSFWELILPLVIGGEMVLARTGGEKDSEYLSKVIEKQGITLVHFVPSMLSAFLLDVESSFPSLTNVVCSGEALPESVVSSFSSKMGTTQLYNLYGPTEAAIDVTAINLSTYKGSGVPIGKPVSNTQIYILGENNVLQPIGVKGELCIGGVQVSKGYLHNEALTDEKYTNNPYGAGKLYRTGDVARWDANGNIEYLGREDSQIKLRGYRIELGEITRVVENYDGISQAVVIKGEIGQSEQLLCYYTGDTENQIDENNLKAYLSAQLPSYMVPSHYQALLEFPLTSNGKLDKKQLPAIHITHQAGEQAAQTKDEKAMVAIWEGLLGICPIGIETSFFELGGDSIKAIQLMSRSKQQGYHFKVKDVFKHPTVKGLLSVCGASETVLIETGLLEGDFELLPIQHRFIEANHPAPHHYNQSVLLSIPKDLSSETLQRSLSKLIDHHDILRSIYKDGQGFYQPEMDNYYKEEIAADEKALTALCQTYQESFDLSTGPLIYFVKITYAQDTKKDRLFIVAHHLVIDGVSWRIVLEDLEQLLSHQNYQLPAKQSSLRQWSNGLSAYASSLSESQQDYWQEISKEYSIFKDPQTLSGTLETHSNNLHQELTKSLSQEIHGIYGTELQDVLLGCLSKVLGNQYDSSKIYIDIEGHGREEIISGLDISRTVGWFTSLYPLKLEVSETIGVQLRDTKDMLREVPDGGLGYGALRYLSDTPEAYTYSKGGILFNYLGDFDGTVSEEGLVGFAGEST